MAIQKAVQISFDYYGDGSTTVLDIDLERDPFSILNSPITSNLINSAKWPNDARTNKPVAAKNGTASGIAFTASVAYPTLMLTFATAPGLGEGSATVNLLFN